MRTTAVWICCCAYLNCLGWFLSAIHQLNAASYAVAVLAGFGALWLWSKRTGTPLLPRMQWRPVRRRFSKILPLIFLTVALLEFLGGILYAPNNFDALTYRLPRMLNWLAAGHWFWIQTINERLNYSTAGWEWIALPLLAILRSDRGLFLIDVVSFILMPGLIFSVFRRLGVAHKAAWAWMWIFPLAFGYATQAASIGNDLTGTVFALAAVCFGLRARSSEKVEDIWLAGLAAALMSGVKLSNAPLALPCLVAVWPALPQLRKRWPSSMIVAVLAMLISATPIMVLNQKNTGSWAGDPANQSQIQIKSPGAALLGNSLLLAQQSFMPPALPGARKVDESLNKHLPVAWQQALQAKFPRYYLNHLNELPQEETAGLGLGVTSLLLMSMVAAVWRGCKTLTGANLFSGVALVGYATWAAVLFYLLKMGSEATARLMLPYYALAAAPLLRSPVQGRFAASGLWKIFAAGAALCVLPAVVLSPSRPLFSLPVMEQYLEHHPEKAWARRLTEVYTVYSHRNDLLAPLRAALPEDAKKIGYVAGSNDTDYSLWRPFGTREVVCLQNDIRNSSPLPEDIEWMVVKRNSWAEFSNVPLEEWATQHHGTIALSVPLVTAVSWGEETWCVVHVQKP